MASALSLEKKSIKNSEYVLDIRIANTYTRRALRRAQKSHVTAH